MREPARDGTMVPGPTLLEEGTDEQHFSAPRRPAAAMRAAFQQVEDRLRTAGGSSAPTRTGNAATASTTSTATSATAAAALAPQARADHSRFVQRIRRRYGELLGHLAPGLPDAAAMRQTVERLQAAGRDLGSALRVTRQLVLERLAVLDVEHAASLDDVTHTMTTLAEVDSLFREHAEMSLGEFVVLIEGESPTPEKGELTQEQRKMLTCLMREVSLKSAVSLTCEISGARREVVYREALRLAAAQENGKS